MTRLGACIRAGCIFTTTKQTKTMSKDKTPAKQVHDLLNSDQIAEFARLDSLKTFLNHNVPDTWIKEHPYIKGHKYLPIDKVEYLLDKIFKRHKIEVIKSGMLMNAVEVTVRVHYWNPIFNEWDFHDGVGAAELQTVKDSGSLKMDMSNVNRGAVPMALPIAKSFAIKDACDHIGRIFGRDLNRKDIVAFTLDKNLQDKAARLDNLLNVDENE
jgi:hypothetical protein